MSDRYEYSAALLEGDMSFRLVGVAFAEDEYPDARDRVMGEYAAWVKENTNCIVVRRVVSPWEVDT